VRRLLTSVGEGDKCATNHEKAESIHTLAGVLSADRTGLSSGLESVDAGLDVGKAFLAPRRDLENHRDASRSAQS
jgi:hypothetical protein